MPFESSKRSVSVLCNILTNLFNNVSHRFNQCNLPVNIQFAMQFVMQFPFSLINMCKSVRGKPEIKCIFFVQNYILKNL